VFTLQHPFPEIDNEEVVIRTAALGDMSRPQQPTEAKDIGCTTDVWNTMRSCWKHVPAERAKVVDVLAQLKKAQDEFASSSQA
jgi:hypothetical protein